MTTAVQLRLLSTYIVQDNSLPMQRPVTSDLSQVVDGSDGET
jgi:hypothetical protein